METLFYVASAVAVISTLMVITRRKAMHALLYLIVSLLSIAFIFFLLGAPFVAALEVILYAGAIMVLFVFVIMLTGPEAVERERRWLGARMFVGPCLLGAVLLAEVAYVIYRAESAVLSPRTLQAEDVGLALFGPYLMAVELASLLLLAGLVGAYHLGRRQVRNGAP